MTPRFAVHTIDDNFIDPVEPPGEFHEKLSAWDDVKRRILTYPDAKTVVADPATNTILWQTDPVIPTLFQVCAIDRYDYYETDPYELVPVHILSSHPDQTDAWAAYHAAARELEEASDRHEEIIILRNTAPLGCWIATTEP